MVAAIALAACTQSGPDTGRLIVQNSDDHLEAMFEATVLRIDADGCTSTESGLGVVWPRGTTWIAQDSAVLLSDGSILSDGTVFNTGGGAVALTPDDLRSFDEWIDPATVTDSTSECSVGDQYLVIGEFESVVEQ